MRHGRLEIELKVTEGELPLKPHYFALAAVRPELSGALTHGAQARAGAFPFRVHEDGQDATVECRWKIVTVYGEAVRARVLDPVPVTGVAPSVQPQAKPNPYAVE